MNYSGKILDGNFPEPYSKEELQEKLKELLAGSLEARDEIITHNLCLVMSIAKKYHQNNDLSELFQVGIIGLIKSVDTFNYEKNPNFITYAYSCITNEILMFLRKNKRRKSEISFEDALNYDAEGNELHLEDILGTDEDIVYKEFENKVDKRTLELELNSLNNRERLIMKLRYGLNNTEEYTQKEVASMLGISQSYISRIEKKVIKKLKNTMKVT